VPGEKFFEQHIGALGHAKEQLAAALMLQIQRYRVLVLVEHCEGQRRALPGLGAPPPRLAVTRLDFDHEGARFR